MASCPNSLSRRRRGAPHWLLTVGGLSLLAFASSASAADNFPEQDLTVVLPVGPGGNVDTVARQLQPYIADELGVDIVIENIEGGQQALGVQHVANAEPDCYTILFHLMPNMMLGSWLQDAITYEYEDFAPLVSVNWSPAAIRFRNDAPWDSFEEMLEDARSRPGEIAVGLPGLNTHYMSMMTLQDIFDVEFNLVLLGSSGGQKAAFRAGDVDIIYTGVYSSYNMNDMSFVAALNLGEGKENVWPEFTNNAKTLEEITGVPTHPADNLFGYFAPAGCKQTYPDRFKRLVDAIYAAVTSEGFKADLKALGEEGKLRQPILVDEEFDRWIREEHLPEVRKFVEYVREQKLAE